MGPTASGKTALAISLAEALNGELISVDSALVYRGLDIGSAKPDYPHWLVDISDPATSYSAAQFAIDARRAIADIRARDRRPILVGGSMLYFRALLQGLAPMPGANAQVRAELEARAARVGWPVLHAELALVDPVSAARIHPNHSQRILRALEVFKASGVPLSDLHARQSLQKAQAEQALCVALAPKDRHVLHARIGQRFQEMVEAGLVNEVRALHARGDLSADLPAIRAVGYRQIWSYLEGECSLDEAIDRGVAATRQLAKRQFTWLRKWPDLRWLRTNDAQVVVESDLCAGDELPANPANLLLSYLAQR